MKKLFWAIILSLVITNLSFSAITFAEEDHPNPCSIELHVDK